MESRSQSEGYHHVDLGLGTDLDQLLLQLLVLGLLRVQVLLHLEHLL